MNDGMTPHYPSARLVSQFCSFHIGRVVKAGDPECRGRVKVTVPGLLSEGKKNWTAWVERGGGLPIGGTDAEGDEGLWKSLKKGQAVMVGFVSGHPDVMWLVPGMPCQKGKGKGKAYIPKEVKKAGKEKPLDATRLEVWKDSAGSTILMDSRGKKEKLAFMDWTGAGIFSVCPGKEEDEDDKDDEEDKPRKGERRGTKMVVTGTSKPPKEIMKDGWHMIRLCDLNGGGAIWFAKDGAGLAVVYAAKKNGEIGPSLLLDAQKNNAYLTAGEQQIQVLGEKNLIAVTYQVLLEYKKVPVEDAIKACVDAMKEAFKEFDEDGGGSGSGSGGSGGGMGV